MGRRPWIKDADGVVVGIGHLPGRAETRKAAPAVPQRR